MWCLVALHVYNPNWLPPLPAYQGMCHVSAGRVTCVSGARRRSNLQPPKRRYSNVSTGFFDALSFGGPGPERINGRLAMLGFVSAIAVELASGADVADQLANGGLLWFAGSAALFSVASLVPLLKGVTAQSKSDGVMTSEAEMLNGRFAMLGLVALVFTEYLKGGPLV
ncbi:hypothetical protein QJS10_CPA08g00278 [Acorus calamus]|uniref:Early light-induced protein n=1 Tax=Acorus calamus TaxID=4465 RepID=A0AAV9ECV0_ACOCL|nr:hypothetical protein QJS10_CPA08g00278 [Acorus calamus]